MQLKKQFYTNTDPVSIAKSLLGKQITVGHGESKTSAIIIETEAYRAPDDKGCHAYNNRKTPRTEVMFEEGGVVYMYKCYGIHNMFNVVTAEKGMAHAVLVRAVEVTENLVLAQKRRNSTINNHILTGGPGKVCQAMGIEMIHNGVKLYDPKSPIRILENPDFCDFEIVETPRVGMSKHVAECANWPWRFYIKGSKFVSRPLELRYEY